MKTSFIHTPVVEILDMFGAHSKRHFIRCRIPFGWGIQGESDISLPVFLTPHEMALTIKQNHYLQYKTVYPKAYIPKPWDTQKENLYEAVLEAICRLVFRRLMVKSGGERYDNVWVYWSD